MTGTRLWNVAMGGCGGGMRESRVLSRGSPSKPSSAKRSCQRQTQVAGPPPSEKLPQLLSSLEKYIHADDQLPKLVRTGLLHAQFETIHPYLDGNGRIGRLMIALLLEHWGT
ncbi:Fic family protein [Mesorhizobium sp. M1088]|uniref:Fic family protein n=1 Tax=Mesorhizobium sp. M1088 TaxID=2957056 RepID=UPI00333903D9